MDPQETTRDQRDWYEFAWLEEAAEAFQEAADTKPFPKIDQPLNAS